MKRMSKAQKEAVAKEAPGKSCTTTNVAFDTEHSGLKARITKGAVGRAGQDRCRYNLNRRQLAHDKGTTSMTSVGDPCRHTFCNVSVVSV